MRCENCDHWNSCPRCTDYICEMCGEPLEEAITIKDFPDDPADGAILENEIRRVLNE